MSRIRYIKPSFFMDEELSELPPDAQLLFVGLWVLADRDGRLEDRPRFIKANLFPYREVDVEARLAELARGGFIARYTLEGKACIAVRNFQKHQRPHPKETSYGLPPPPENVFSRPAVKFHGKVRKVDQPSGKVAGPSRGNGEWGMENGDGDGEPAARAAAAPPPKAPSQPALLEEAHPRRQLSDALVAAFEQARGHKYDFTGRDAKALDELLSKAGGDVAEVVRRWRYGLHLGAKWPGCSNIHHLADRWNDLSAPATAPPKQPQDVRRGVVRAEDALERMEPPGEVQL